MLKSVSFTNFIQLCLFIFHWQMKELNFCSATEIDSTHPKWQHYAMWRGHYNGRQDSSAFQMWLYNFKQVKPSLNLVSSKAVLHLLLVLVRHRHICHRVPRNPKRIILMKIVLFFYGFKGSIIQNISETFEIVSETNVSSESF